MPPSNVNPSVNPQAAKFLEWYKEEQKHHGLVDLKFYPGNTSDSTLEEFFSEVNAALAAPVASDERDF